MVLLPKLCREVDATLEDESSIVDRTKVLHLIVLSEQLDTKWKALSTLDRKIASVCPLTGELNDSEPIEAKLLKAKRKIYSYVKKVPGEPAVSPSPAVAHKSPAVNRPRLPKLTLSRFRGNVTQWSSFWDAFKSGVHSNPDLPAIDNFNYLNSLIEGTAARTIHGLMLNEANYDAAVQLLEDRYGKCQLIISEHMKEIANLPVCSVDKASPLRYVFDKINVH